MVVMNTVNINNETLQRLQGRAAQAGCSLDVMLNRLLDAEEEIETLRANEARYRFLLDHTSDAITLHHPDGRVIYANPINVEMTGYTLEELQALSIDELNDLLVHPDDLAEASEHAYEQILRGEEIYKLTYRMRHKNGTYFWCETSAKPIFDESGQVVQIVSAARDVTANKISAQALAESEARYKVLTELMSDYIVSVKVRPDGILHSEWVLGAFTEITGFPVGMQGNVASMINTHPDDVERVHSDIADTIQHNKLTTTEYRVRKNGTEADYVWLRISRYPFWDEDAGRVVRFYSVAQDITKRKQAEEALRQSEARMRSLVESQAAFVVRTDLHGNYTYCNKPYLERHGLPDDIIGTSSFNTILPEDHDRARAAAAECMKSPGKSVQVLLRKPTTTGEILWELWDFAAITDAASNIAEIQCMGFDITGRKQAEDALRESEARYKLLTEILSDYAFAIRVEPDGSRTYEWTMGKMDHITRQPLPEQPVDTNNIHPDDRGFVAADIARTMQNQPTISEYRVETKAGDYAWLRMARKPVWSEEEGRVVRFYCVATDITSDKQAQQFALEKERLTANLRAEKDYNMKIQNVVAALAHDLKTPLTVIHTAKDILTNYYDRIDTKRRLEKLESIGQQVQYIKQLLDDLTLIAGASLKRHRLQLARINLEVLCQITIQDMQESVGPKHRMIFSTDKQIVFAKVDEVLVSRILLNLLSNAIKYSAKNSEIRLELSRDDDEIVLRVVDEGFGIHPKDQEHVFQPFYRAKETENIRGTGLGLSIVKDCVAQLQGHIEFHSQPDEGTTFTVRLPLVE